MGKISEEDKILIKNLRIEKKWGARKMLNEFPRKQWTRSGVERLIRQIDATGDIERKTGSGRLKSVRTPANIAKVEELICSQENAPGTHKTHNCIE